MILHLENGEKVTVNENDTCDLDELCEQISNDIGYCVLSVEI